MGLFGPPNVAKLEEKRDVNGLIKALGYMKDSEVRRDAAKALDVLGWKPGRDVTTAQYWIVKGNFDECVKLGSIAVEPLIAAFKDEDWFESEAAAKALVKIGDARAVEPFISILQDKDSRKRRAAAEALDALDWRPGRDDTIHYWIAKKNWDKCASLGSIAVEPLIAVLGGQDAAEALWKIGAPAFEPLITALKDEKWEVRKAAAMALGEIGTSRAIQPLIALLKDDVEYVQKVAAEGLGKIGDARAVEPLIALFGYKSENVRRAAVESLVKIGASAVKPLISVLKEEYWDVRWIAAEALVKIGDTRAIKPVIAALKVALKHINKDVRQVAAATLGKIADPLAVEPLIVALKDRDALKDINRDVCRVAAATLGKIADPLAVEPLIVALMDEEWVVRQAAAKALVTLYRIGVLDEQARKRILEMKVVVTKRHDDYFTGCPAEHEDSGIGVTF